MSHFNDRDERRIPEGAGIVVGVILGAILWGIIALGIWLFICEQDTEDRIVPRATVEKMRYHGVHTVYEDWNGNEYFIREGKRCRL